MNQTSIDDHGGLAVPGQRRDTRRRDIVDLGIAVQGRSNTVAAVEYLRSHDIGAAIIARVLAEPERRRGPLV